MAAKFSPQHLTKSVEGDLAAFSLLVRQPAVVLHASRAPLDELVLTTRSVRNILRLLQAGKATPRQVQQWASFMRRGYIPRPGEAILPIDIEYDPAHEEEIANIVSRLDEIGDMIDGQISDEELGSMLGKLPSAR